MHSAGFRGMLVWDEGHISARPHSYIYIYIYLYIYIDKYIYLYLYLYLCINITIHGWTMVYLTSVWVIKLHYLHNRLARLQHRHIYAMHMNQRLKLAFCLYTQYPNVHMIDYVVVCSKIHFGIKYNTVMTRVFAACVP